MGKRTWPQSIARRRSSEAMAERRKQEVSVPESLVHS